MATFRVKKNRNYTVMSNYHLRDKNLSLKAKGLLSIMLSLPEDWNYTLGGLVAISKEGLTSIRSALDELKKNRYLEVEKVKDASGRFDYQYNIYEHPVQKAVVAKERKETSHYPDIGNPHLDNLHL